MNQSEFWGRAAMILNDLHSFDPEMILQGCLFGIVATEVDSVPIPPPGAFEDFDLPSDQRRLLSIDVE